MSEKFIVSKNGFNGSSRIGRLALDYLRQKEVIKIPPTRQEFSNENMVITIGTTENELGVISKISCRPTNETPNSPKSKVVLFEATNQKDFLQYLEQRPYLVLATTSSTVIEFALQVLNQKIADMEAIPPPLNNKSLKRTYPNFLRSLKDGQASENIKEQAVVLQENGFWSNEDSFNRYQMRLSPDSCQITKEDYKNLSNLSNILFQENGILPGTAQLLVDWQSGFINSEGKKLLPETIIALNYLTKLSIQKPDNYPSVVRLDLGRTITNSGNRFSLFELEGTKTHAFGYLTLADQSFPKKFFKLLEERDWQNKPVFLIVGQAKNEEFYSIELDYFTRNLNQSFNTKLTVINEQGTVPLLARSDEVLFINLPQFKNQKLRQQVIDSYSKGKARFLMPPNEAFGDKTLLYLLSNARNDQVFESIISQYIDQKSLDILRSFLPATLLATKNTLPNLNRDSTTQYVFKLPNSSGAAGVLLPGSNQNEDVIVDQIYQNFAIAQEFVDVTPMLYQWVEPTSLGQVQQTKMFERIELFCVKNLPPSMLATANENRAVHGGRNSIQVPIAII